MLTIGKAKHHQFCADERGTVALIFGLSFLMLMFTLGMGMDMSRVVNVRTQLASAADAASLAAGKALLDGRNSEDEVRDVARMVFDQNLGSIASDAVISDFEISVDRGNGSVVVDLNATLPMLITRIANFNEVTLPVTSAVLYNQQDIELGMALDSTGSMSGSKITDLKGAAKELVDIMLPDDGTPNRVRIAIAPYSASVNLGAYAAVASNNVSRDGCVRERTGSERYTDAAPALGAYYAAGSATDTDSTEGRQGYSCPGTPVRPLTDVKADLKATIDNLNARGATAGHIGASWAWNLVSPNWDQVWPVASRPAPYNDGRTLKAIILMTDGIFNTAYANDRSAAQAVALCNNMKAENVVVYAVGFQAPAGAAATLRACASTEDHYFDASDGTALRQAFISIAQQLNALRLTQ